MFKTQFPVYDIFSKFSDKPVKNRTLECAEQIGLQQHIASTVIQTASLFFFKAYGIIFCAVI
jgi:hypothetical protein